MTLRLLLSFVAVVVAAPFALSQDYFATNVPNTTNWTGEGRAEGAPPNSNCNMGTPDYAVNDAGTTWLVATNLENVSVPPGQAVDTVSVGVHCRYDTNEAGSLRLQALWGSNTVGQDYTINNGSGDCRWRAFDLTFAEPDFWSQAELNSMQLRVRRISTNNNNDLRVKGFRLSVTFGPDCNSNGITDMRDLAMGAPDCNGNQIPDDCELAGNDCNSNGIHDSCELLSNDCNHNGIPDDCDYSSGLLTDCNGNGRADQCSGDCNGNGVPDDIDICNGFASCNNRDLDVCEIANGADDCNGDGVPDDCTLGEMRTRSDEVTVPFGMTTIIDIAANDTGFDPTLVEVVPVSTNPIGGPQYGTIAPGSAPGTMAFSSSNGAGECGTTFFRYRLESLPTCPTNFVSDEEEITVRIAGAQHDCNMNCIDDSIEIMLGQLTDCDGDCIPTICETGIEDCNGNGVADCMDIANMTVSDINQNGVPDSCEEFEMNFCEPMVNSAGCISVMNHIGEASLQSSTLIVYTANVLRPNFGLLLWSRTATSFPLGGGTLCLGSPIRRTPIVPSAQSPELAPCDGLIVYRWSSSELMAQSFQVGDQVYCQFWSRDVQAPSGLNLTDGIEFTVLP